MTTRWVIGLSSGSSAAGIEAALLEVEGTGLGLSAKLVESKPYKYGTELRQLVQKMSQVGTSNAKEISLLHRLLGEAFAGAARQVADQASLCLEHVLCIGCTGHTLWHEFEGRFPSTLSVGMAACVAERTGVTVVHDFRSRDLAVGGQGVPLVALADYLLFGSTDEHRVLVHLGGIARVVSLPADCRLQEIVGFEAGPCNLLLDGFIRHLTSGREAFDAGGKHAVQGRCVESLLRRWREHPYFQKRPPKCLPRYHFGPDFVTQALTQARQANYALHDVLCTATHFVAQVVVDSLTRFIFADHVPDRVLLSGGGVKNGLLWHLLEQQLAGVKLDRTDRFEMPAEIRKASAVGIMAALTLDGVEGNLPSATGAAASRLLGSLTPGSTRNWARCLQWMVEHSTPLMSAYE